MTNGKIVSISNNTIIIGGRDEHNNRYYVAIGPAIRNIYAIMWFDEEGHWVPYKMYKSVNNKIRKHAMKQVRNLRRTQGQKFKLDVIWEAVPLEEMEKVYYDTEEEIRSKIDQKIKELGLEIDPEDFAHLGGIDMGRSERGTGMGGAGTIVGLAGPTKTEDGKEGSKTRDGDPGLQHSGPESK